MDDFNWDDLRFFLSVARAGRLTTAARRIGVDHATMSRRITALETALKTKLFERSPQGYALTARGERLLVSAEAIEAQAVEVSTTIGGADVSLAGTVRIGSPDGLGTMFLAPRLAEMSRLFPELEIQLFAMPQLISLSKREADIAVTLAPPKEGKIVARKLTDFTMGLYASRSYLERNPPITRMEHLLDHSVIGYIEDLIFTPELDYLDEIGKGLHLRLTSSSLVVQMHIAASGGGLCVLPHFMAAADSRLVPVLPREMSIMRTYWLLVHADLRDIARIRATVDLLLREVKAARAMFVPPLRETAPVLPESV